ncbi:fatty acid desaturase [Roseibium aquae]|uniref:fatty acid desaturase n=1 Tax=Roseibium aquae TaxID=1323746 RepID=UPI00123DB2C3|nr:fatty acid desaturase [Roseibium aquae]
MPRTPVCEWPTLALILGVSVAWSGLVALSGAMPIWIALPLAALAVTLHSSLQHEVLHGHPTRHGWINEALVYFPIGLFIPYRRFKSLHLQHHNNDRLTDPYDDPESFYLAWADWQRLPRPIHLILVANNTLAGRLTIGPAVSLVGFYGSEIRLLLQGHEKVWNAWMHHALGLLPVLWFVSQIAGLPIWLYVLSIAYPGMCLLMLRTYAEHRAHVCPEARSIIVESCPVFSFLFLNNNLHVVHHSHPQVPWYRLPGLYQARKTAWKRRNGDYVFKGYGALARQYLFKVKEPVVHPLVGNQTPESRRIG